MTYVDKCGKWNWRTPYFARCTSCGWKGPLRPKADECNPDAHDHECDVTPPLLLLMS